MRFHCTKINGSEGRLQHACINFVHSSLWSDWLILEVFFAKYAMYYVTTYKGVYSSLKAVLQKSAFHNIFEVANFAYK